MAKRSGQREIVNRDWLAEHYIERNIAKQAFDSYAEAKDEAERRNERDRVEPDYRPSQPYHCGYCDKFHIGHSNPNKRRRGR